MEVTESVSEQQETKTADDYFKDFGYEKPIEEVVEKVDEESKPDIQSQVNDLLKNIKVDDNGKFIYPDGISPELKAAVAATKSFRDTQSAYTKAQQELKALQAEAAALKEQIAKYETPTAGLSQQEQEQLAELKYSDPDAWYQKMRQLEAQASSKVEEKLKEVTEQARAKTVEQLRAEALEAFNAKAEKPLTQEQLELEIPPRWKQDVLEGKMAFEDLLDKAYAFIYGEKTIAQPEPAPQATNLNQVGGGSPDPKVDTGIDYAHITF
jgi:hypothetical protein